MIKRFYCLAILAITAIGCGSSDSMHQGGVQSILFTGKNQNQPLIVGLGGSEGGNPWATDRWKKTRDLFIDSGYAFLAIGYFDAEGAPDQLDRIALEDVHDAIIEAQKNPVIAKGKVALIGGSKGAELALLLGSLYPDVSCVVSLVGSHAAFPALTFGASTSSWTYQGKEIPFVPATWSSVPSMLKGDLRRAFEIMMEDTAAVTKALIHVENIRGPVLCVSANQDEMWPSTEMSDAVMKRLESHRVPYARKHIIAEGKHTESLDHFPEVLAFLLQHYPVTRLK